MMKSYTPRTGHISTILLEFYPCYNVQQDALECHVCSPLVEPAFWPPQNVYPQVVERTLKANKCMNNCEQLWNYNVYTSSLGMMTQELVITVIINAY